MLSPQVALGEGRLRAAQHVLGQKPVGADSKAAARHEQEIEKAATQFEALLVQEMVKEMWATVPKGGLLSGSSEEDTYQDMYRQALSESIAEHHSIGVKDVIIRDIKATEARTKKADSNGPEGAS
jgi:flagellar protein FlgJ